MKTTLTALLNWTKAHPLIAIGFASILSGIAASLSFRDDWLPVGIPLFLGIALLFGVFIARYKPVALLLIAALLASELPSRAAEPQDNGGGTGGAGCAAAGVAVVVIVVGGILIYKLAKTCQRKFPKGGRTNDLADAGTELVGWGGDSSYGAALNFAEMGSCYQGDICSDQKLPPYDGDGGSGGALGPDTRITTTTLTLRLEAGDEAGACNVALVSLEPRHGAASVQDWPEFVADTKSWGVTVTGHAGDFSYAVNGQPCSGEDFPIRWDAGRRLVKVVFGSAAYYTVTVERSNDLSYWIPLLKTEVEIGSTLEIQDTNPQPQQFYRYSAVLSD